MNTRWSIPLIACAVVFLWTQAVVAGMVAAPVPRQAAQIQRPVAQTPCGAAQVQQPVAQTVFASYATAPAPYLPCGCLFQPDYPVRNVAPWSWQHDNQNDNEWPADHGG